MTPITAGGQRPYFLGIVSTAIVALAIAAGLFIPRVVSLPPKSQNFFSLLLVGLMYLLAIIVRPKTALWIGLLVVTAFISVTGFQYLIPGTGTRISALDCLLLSLALIIIILPGQKAVAWGREEPQVRKAIKRFLWLIPMGAVVATFRGIGPIPIMDLVKAFYFPMLFLMVVPAVVRTKEQLKIIIALALILAVISAFKSRVEGPPLDQPLQKLQGKAVTSLQRSAGEWGTQNPFANYLLFAVLVPAAFAFRIDRPGRAVIMAVLAGVAGWGLLGTFTRGAWLGCSVGMAFLAAADRFNKIIVLFILAAVLVPLTPQAVHERATTSKDSSSEKRENFWRTGWRATMAFPVLGGGWGAGFMLVGDTLYVEGSGVPLWHNDYLVISSQTGLIGLAVFVSMWFSIVAMGIRAARQTNDRFYRPLLFGLTAAVVASLVHAFFEQIFWRFDTAPHNWFLVSCLIVAVLQSRNQTLVKRASAT